MSLKNKTISSVIWSAFDRLGSQGIQFIISIVLARLLLPEQFGLIAMLTIFFAVAQTFMDSGFGSALIQNKEATHLDESSIFYFNVFVGFISATLIYFSAPYVAVFYNQPILEPLIKLLSINLIINSFALVQFTLLSKSLNFKTHAKVSFISVLISGSVGIAIALDGGGVWALAIQQIVFNICRTVLLWFFSNWRPLFNFSFSALQNMFGYSSNMFLAGLLDNVFTNIYLIVIGKLFPPAILGFYTRANSLKDMISLSFTQILSRVMFPVFSSIQDNPEQLKKGVKKAIAFSTFIIFPSMIGLATVAEPLVVVLLTEKWLPSVYYLQLLCFVGMLLPLQAFNLSVIKSKGRSDLYLLLEVAKKILIAVNILITWRWGIEAIIYGQIILSVTSYLLNSFFVRNLINYPIEEQLMDVAPGFLLAAVMGGSVFFIGELLPQMSMISLLLIQILSGVFIYSALALIFNASISAELMSILKKRQS